MPDPAPCDDAARNATPLLSELKRRGARQQVLHYCDIELLKKNFHALMEACKSVFDRLRSISGANGDGAGLVDRTLTFGKSTVPVLAINAPRTQTDKDEQSGFANLLKDFPGYTETLSHITHEYSARSRTPNCSSFSPRYR